MVELLTRMRAIGTKKIDFKRQNEEDLRRCSPLPPYDIRIDDQFNILQIHKPRRFPLN